MKATKIKMVKTCENSDSLLEIDSIYVIGCDNPGYFKKETLHDYLNKSHDIIQVDIAPYPRLVPVMGANGEKYVRSAPNDSDKDNLLCLPRE